MIGLVNIRISLRRSTSFRPSLEANAICIVRLLQYDCSTPENESTGIGMICVLFLPQVFRQVHRVIRALRHCSPREPAANQPNSAR